MIVISYYYVDAFSDFLFFHWSKFTNKLSSYVPSSNFSGSKTYCGDLIRCAMGGIHHFKIDMLSIFPNWPLSFLLLMVLSVILSHIYVCLIKTFSLLVDVKVSKSTAVSLTWDVSSLYTYIRTFLLCDCLEFFEYLMACISACFWYLFFLSSMTLPIS